MDGSTITNGQTLYPNLWAVIPAAMKSGANIVLPDTRGRVSVGYSSGDARFNSIGLTGRLLRRHRPDARALRR